MTVYRFNNLPFYEHQYLSWKNLYYCCSCDYGQEHDYRGRNDGKPHVPALVVGLMLGYPVESTVSIYDDTIWVA